MPAHTMPEANNTLSNAENSAWWGTFEIPAGQSGRWQIGALSLLLEHRHKEWRVSYLRGNGEPEERALREVPTAVEGPLPDATVARFSFRHPSPRISVQAALADRSVVTRPESPFFLPAGEEMTLYISSPAWLRVTVGESAVEMLDIPIYRPSDTWFGPSTLKGELCYASRTHCRTTLEDVPFRPHRAITPVLLRNHCAEALLLERLSLPVPYLSLFSARDGRLWTEAVTLDREEGEEMAAMKWAKGPPPEARHAARIAEPRRSSESSLFVRAFSALFS